MIHIATAYATIALVIFLLGLWINVSSRYLLLSTLGWPLMLFALVFEHFETIAMAERYPNGSPNETR